MIGQNHLIEIAIGLFSDDIDSLLHRISSPSSAEDQTDAANELRRQTKRFYQCQALFFAEIPDSITWLLSTLSALGEAVDWNPDLQKNIITALLNISTLQQNKTVVAQNPLVISVLTKSLKQRTAKTRRNSAVTYTLLSHIDSNKIITENLETLKALIYVIKKGDFLAATEVSLAVFYLCFLLENREQVVSEGLIPVLTNKIKAGGNVYLQLLLSGLPLTATHNGVIEEMEDLGFIDDMFSILRKQSCSESGEYAVEIAHRMCCMNTGDIDRESTRLKVVEEEENKYVTFTTLAKQGSENAVTKAEGIVVRKRF